MNQKDAFNNNGSAQNCLSEQLSAIPTVPGYLLEEYLKSDQLGSEARRTRYGLNFDTWTETD